MKIPLVIVDRQSLLKVRPSADVVTFVPAGLTEQAMGDAGLR